MDEEEQADLNFPQEVYGNKVHGNPEPVMRSPTQAHPAPESPQIRSCVHLIGGQ